MTLLLGEIRSTPLLWLLVFVPLALAGEHLWPEAGTLLFFLSILAIAPLAALLSRALGLVRRRDAADGLRLLRADAVPASAGRVRTVGPSEAEPAAEASVRSALPHGCTGSPLAAR